jgi:hypothetical protein
MVETELISTVVTVGLTILSIVLGFKYGKIRHKFSIFRRLIDHLDEAWKDDKVTDEELRMVIDDILELKEEC